MWNGGNDIILESTNAPSQDWVPLFLQRGFQNQVRFKMNKRACGEILKSSLKMLLIKLTMFKSCSP